MKRTSFAGWPCSIARAVEVLGDGWTLLVLRELFYGQTHFDGFVDGLGIARNTLTDRLRTLEGAGIVERRAYQVDPVRHEYLLSEQGRELFPVLAALNAWGDRWLADQDGVPVVMHHESCGHDAHARVVCSACEQSFEHADVTLRPGPGYPRRLLEVPAVRARFGLSDAPSDGTHRPGTTLSEEPAESPAMRPR